MLAVMTGGLTFAHLPGYRVVWRPFPLVQFEFWLERGGYLFHRQVDPLEAGLVDLWRGAGSGYRARLMSGGDPHDTSSAGDPGPTEAEWQQVVDYFDRHAREKFERRVDERLASTS